MKILFQYFVKSFVVLSFLLVNCKSNDKKDNISLDLLNKSSQEIEINYKKLNIYFTPKLIDSSFILREANIKGTIFENKLNNTYKLLHNKDINEIHVYNSNFIEFKTEIKNDYTTKWDEKLIIKYPSSIEQLKKTLNNNNSKVIELKRLENQWFRVTISKNLD